MALLEKLRINQVQARLLLNSFNRSTESKPLERKNLLQAGRDRGRSSAGRFILSRAGIRIISVSSSTGTERPLRRTRTTVRCGEVEITTPLSPENGPKLMVTTVPVFTVAFRSTQLTAAGRD